MSKGMPLSRSGIENREACTEKGRVLTTTLPMGRDYGCIAKPGGAGLGTNGTRFRFGGAKWRRG